MTFVLAFGGAILGMLLTILVQSYIIQRSDKYAADFHAAFKFYTRKERGAIYIGVCVIFIALFILPAVTANVDPEIFAKKLRFWAVAVGIVSQAIGFALVRKTHEKLNDLESNIKL